MLHVAAQGDQPLSIAYFKMRHDMDINSVDHNEENAVHWAAYSGSELTVSYILAWGGNIDAESKDGETPLFKSITQYNTSKSTRGVK